ncbi:hypothetical protein SAMN06309944_0162 [Micrococcales bacterium KH10]|nr:hypothetical protein SAMN06309944_0162 [Micrococcales bacterium KH10]
MTTQLETREFEIREVNTDQREVSGIAVPYDTVTRIGGRWGYDETIARGAVQDSDDALLFWRHDEPIGKITAHEDRDDGWHITAKISETERGNEAYTLLRDGVIDKFSVGFESREHLEDSETGAITRTAIRVREVSLVPFPAYNDAAVSQVRHKEETAPEKENTMTDKNPEITEIRETVEDLERQLATLGNERNDEPTIDTRSGGEVLKAIAAGDADTIRAYSGGTTADTVVKNGWVGDLTRLVEAGAGIRGLFATGTLPSEGNFIEYGVLDTDTSEVSKQDDEGDDLAFGKVSVTTATAPVETFGGYTSLTRQEIERSSVAILDTALRGQAIASGKALNAAFRAFFAAQRAAQVTADNVVEIPETPDYMDWLDAVVDAAEKYDDLGLTLDALVVSKDIFKAFNRFEGADGRPLFTVSGTGANTVGSLDVKGLKGDIANIPVVPNLKQAASGATFVNSLALRSYNSGAVQLQDENIINLSKDFSTYYYSALAAEIPAAIIPVVEAA